MSRALEGERLDWGGSARKRAPPVAMQIAFESPRQPDVVALIEELDAYQRPLYPAESHHGIDIDQLDAPHVL